MKPIRHLIAIVFLLCGLAARGSDTSSSSSKRKGKNDIWKDLIEQVVHEVVG